MRFYFALAASVLAVSSSCKVDEPALTSRSLATDGLPGNIRAAIGPESKTAAGEFEIYTSAPTGVQSVAACAGIVLPADCRVGATGYLNGTKTATKGTLDIFRLDGAVKPAAGAQLIVVARDAVGAVSEAQKINFSVKGTGGAGTTTPDLSAGTGGQKGKFEGQFGSNGKYIINAPQDNSATKAHGLLILLHGSTASSYDRFVDEMADVSTKNGLIPVSVLAPNGQGWNEGDQNAAVTYLDDFIQTKLLKEYNVDKKKIFFSGQSSGGGFLASHFIPAKGPTYRGGAFLQCGMMPPQVTFTPNDAMKQGFKLHFEITTSDGLWTQYFEQAVNSYKTAGITVTSDDTKTGGHCQFDQAQIIAERIGPMLGP